MKRPGWAALVVMGVLVLASAAWAHRSNVFAVYTLSFTDPQVVRWTLRVDAIDLGTLLQLDTNVDARFSGEELSAGQPVIEGYLRERLSLVTDGVACGELHVEAVRAQEPPLLVDIVGTFRCPQAYGVVDIGIQVLRDYAPSYRYFVEVETSDEVLQQTLGTDESVLSVRAGAGVVAPSSEGTGGTPSGDAARELAAPASGLSIFADFVMEGIRHIFIGYDHIAFILGLTLAAASLRRLVSIITAFTVAHTLTLGLATLEIVNVPSSIAESLIALSVAYVGFENLWRREPKRRIYLALGFGLVHGLGFSSVLVDLFAGTSVELGGRVRDLLGFNLGVEIGQVAIVAVVTPFVALARRAGQQRRLVVVLSLAILALGLYWFTERVLLAV